MSNSYVKIEEPPKNSREAARALGISRRELTKTLERIGDADATCEKHGRKLLFYPEHIQAIRFARANGWVLEGSSRKISRRSHDFSKRLRGLTLDQAIKQAKEAGVRTTKGRKK